MARKDLLTRLADAGEEAIGRLGESPGADRLLGVATNMRDRMDELQKRVRGLDDLERRVEELERRLAEAEGGSEARKPAARKSPAKKAAKSSAEKASKPRTKSARTARSGSKAEPTGPATQGASQAGNPGA